MKYRRRRLVALGLVALVVTVPAMLLLDLRLAYVGSPAACARSSGTDALWLGHAWVDGRHSTADVSELAERLSTTGIRDVFVHVGPLDDDGSLDAAKRPTAGLLIETLHSEVPGLRVQGWIGNILAPDRLDLGNDSTRANVADSAGQLTESGFDGVHVNIEPVPSGDEDYLDLLRLVRGQTEGSLLSVAAEPAEPRAGLAAASDLVRPPLYWTGDYLGRVASHVDQVAVMAYDTGLPTESLYGGMVTRQTTVALGAVPDDVQVLIGAPAFHTDNLGHHESAETVHAAATGTRLGITKADACSSEVGLALYVDFDATDSDWAAYCRDWLEAEADGDRCRP